MRERLGTGIQRALGGADLTPCRTPSSLCMLVKITCFAGAAYSQSLISPQPSSPVPSSPVACNASADCPAGYICPPAANSLTKQYCTKATVQEYHGAGQSCGGTSTRHKSFECQAGLECHHAQQNGPFPGVCQFNFSEIGGSCGGAGLNAPRCKPGLTCQKKSSTSRFSAADPGTCQEYAPFTLISNFENTLQLRIK